MGGECPNIEQHAIVRLRTLPWQHQRAIIARGSLLGGRNPTAVLMGRITEATRGSLYFSREAMVWTVASEPHSHAAMLPMAGMQNGVVQNQTPAPTDAAAQGHKPSVWDGAKKDDKSNDKDDIDAI